MNVSWNLRDVSEGMGGFVRLSSRFAHVLLTFSSILLTYWLSTDLDLSASSQGRTRAASKYTYLHTSSRPLPVLSILWIVLWIVAF